MGETLVDKIWRRHVVAGGDADLVYVDLHLIHEVTSPQAFEGLRLAGRDVRRPDLTIATSDHDVPTDGLFVSDPIAARQLEAQQKNCADFGIELHPMGTEGQGIVHVIGPQMGLTLPGMVIVCGDSHTSTHGAFGTIAFGIGTSQVEHVLATQTLRMAKPERMAVTVDGQVRDGVSGKDIALAIIAKIGTAGGRGAIIEFRGEAIRALSMEGRMTLCNMAIEAGSLSGIVAPDDVTFDYLEGRPRAPQGVQWDEAVAEWRSLITDPDATFDRTAQLDAAQIGVQVSWGTNPGQTVGIDEAVPDPSDFDDPRDQAMAEKALTYMGLEPGTPMRGIAVDKVFIGSCTNGRIEDFRAVAEVVRGRRIKDSVTALAVPGSMQVKAQAEAEGLDKVLEAAGFEWRLPGCSMCIAMNSDKLQPGERGASTSNRNFEGRQGAGGRTHLVSPASAAATAVAGRLATPDDLD